MPASLQIKVLGCHGGEMAGYLTPSLLINQDIMLDAGSFSTELTFKQQLRLDHVLISHAHCDHVKSLALFADLIIGHRKKPVKVYASPGAMKVIRGDFFNNRFWPNFFVLPNPTGTFVYTGDTGPTHNLWKAVNRVKNLKLLMIETKFPNDLQVVADAAGHLTPRTLEQELKKIKASRVPIVLYHLKPDRMRDLEREIAALGDRRIRIMKIGDRFKV
jgi:ribonuclease BN (tRNA processing enzyme)